MKKLKETINRFIKKYREIIVYIVVGGLTTVISLVSYYALTLTILNPDNPIQLQIANIISWILAVTFAYFSNRTYVFQSKNDQKLKESALFYASRLGTLLLEVGIMFVSVSVFGFNDKIMKIVAQFIILITNYLLSKFFIFIPSKKKPASK